VTQRDWMVFEVFKTQPIKPCATQSNLLADHAVSRRFNQRAPEVPSRLYYPVILQ